MSTTLWASEGEERGEERGEEEGKRRRERRRRKRGGGREEEEEERRRERRRREGRGMERKKNMHKRDSLHNSVKLSILTSAHSDQSL